MSLRILALASFGIALVVGAQQPPAKAAQKAPTPAKSSSKSTAKGAVPLGDPTLPLRLVTAGEGNVARYRVRERLAGRDLDNDAVGETPKVSGSISLDRNGKLVPGESGFTVDLASITSDQSRRDNYVRRRVLNTDSFPTTTFRATEIRGLPSPVPTAGEARFQLVGNLTMKGVTRPSVWEVVAKVTGTELRGTARTRFTFADFSLPQPRVPIVLSLADTIGLEYDFVMHKLP